MFNAADWGAHEERMSFEHHKVGYEIPTDADDRKVVSPKIGVEEILPNRVEHVSVNLVDTAYNRTNRFLALIHIDLFSFPFRRWRGSPQPGASHVTPIRSREIIVAEKMSADPLASEAAELESRALARVRAQLATEAKEGIVVDRAGQFRKEREQGLRKAIID